MLLKSLLCLLLVWGGISIGVAFIATPAKFLAPTLTLPVAFDVGRQTFKIYNDVEIGLSILAITLALSTNRRLRNLLDFVVPISIVMAQALWLFPHLEARVLLLQAGNTPEPSYLHALYVVAEIVKILALFFAALIRLRSL